MFKKKDFKYFIKLANDKKIWCNEVEYTDIFLLIDTEKSILRIPYTSILLLEEYK
jgi:hypothetical protein